jgi:hypothetical protein
VDFELYWLELLGPEDMAQQGANSAPAGRGITRFPQMHLQPFDGDPRRFREFRRTLDIVFSASPGTTDIEQLALVIGLLSGDAKGWWMSKPDAYHPHTWKELLADLQNELLGGSRHALWAELHHRALRAGESLYTYKYDIANLCEMLGVVAPDQVGCFVRGLPEQVRNAVSAQDPADLDAAYQIAKRIMEFASPTPLKTAHAPPPFPSIFGNQKGSGKEKELDYGSGSDSTRDSGGLSKEIADLTQQLSQITLHLLKEKESRPMPMVRSFGTGGQIICGKCLKPGHIQRNCSNPPDPSAVRCANCSFYGHKEGECRKPPRAKSHLLEVLSGFNGGESALRFDDGHDLEDQPEEPVVHSGFMGFTLTSPVAFPPCEFWMENEELVSAPLCVESEKKVRFVESESDADSESSFEVTTSESDDVSCSTQPEVINPVRKAKRPSHLQKKAQARTREEVEEEDMGRKKEHRKELREERRTSNYRVMEAVMGSQVPLLSEVGGKLSYFRKDAHDWMDSRVLKYIPRKRPSAKDAAFSKLQSFNHTVEPESHGAWTYDSKAASSLTSHGQLRHIMARFGNVSVPAVVDTGSQISVLSYSFVTELGMQDQINTKKAPRFTGSDLQSHKARGTLTLTMALGKLKVKTVFTVVDGPSSSFRVLIGQDILGPTYPSCCNESMEVRFKVPNGTYVRCPFVSVAKN